MPRRKNARTRAVGLALAPAVAMMRLPLMAAEMQANSFHPRESLSAVTEKSVALAEGIAAAQLSLFRSALGFWPAMLAGGTPAGLGSAALERAFHASLGPASRRVTANHRRLSSRKP